MGGTPPRKKGGAQGSSAGQVMDAPQKGRAHLSRTWGDGKGGLSWAGHGVPPQERGFTWAGLRETPWGRGAGTWRIPLGKGGLVCVHMGDTSESGVQGGLSRSGFRGGSGQLAQPRNGGPPGKGVQLSRTSEDSDTSFPSRVSIFLMTMARDFGGAVPSGGGGGTEYPELTTAPPNTSPNPPPKPPPNPPVGKREQL